MDRLSACAAGEHDQPVRQIIAASRCRAEDTAPEVPLLVLASMNDRLVSPNCSKRIGQAWNATLRIHPDAGHDLALDDGEWIVGEVGKWMEQLTRKVNSEFGLRLSNYLNQR